MQKFWLFWLGDCLASFENLGNFFKSSGHPVAKSNACKSIK
jgi:hypothetical protein